MAGFFTSTTPMRLYTVSGTIQDYTENLENAAFCKQPKDVGAEEKIVGFVGLGDPLDYEFLFPVQHEKYIAISLRIDERKPSMAAVRMRLAEALKKEAEEKNGKVSRERKKELKEEVLLQVTAKSDFVPTLVDCILDQQTNRLLIATTAESQALLATELFSRVFGVTIEAVQPEEDMSSLFQKIYMERTSIAVPVEDGKVATLLSDDYIATLQSPEASEEKATVSIRGSQESGLKALEEGLYIRRMGIAAEVAQAGEDPIICNFMLDDALLVTGLKMPKHEKGNEREDDFFLKAGHAFLVAEIVEKLGQYKDA